MVHLYSLIIFLLLLFKLLLLLKLLLSLILAVEEDSLLAAEAAVPSVEAAEVVAQAAVADLDAIDSL